MTKRYISFAHAYVHDNTDFFIDILSILKAIKPLLKSYDKQNLTLLVILYESNRKAMNRNWSNQKANPALKTKTGNK